VPTGVFKTSRAHGREADATLAAGRRRRRGRAPRDAQTRRRPGRRHARRQLQPGDHGALCGRPLESRCSSRPTAHLSTVCAFQLRSLLRAGRPCLSMPARACPCMPVHANGKHVARCASRLDVAKSSAAAMHSKVNNHAVVLLCLSRFAFSYCGSR